MKKLILLFALLCGLPCFGQYKISDYTNSPSLQPGDLLLLQRGNNYYNVSGSGLTNFLTASFLTNLLSQIMDTNVFSADGISHIQTLIGSGGSGGGVVAPSDNIGVSTNAGPVFTPFITGTLTNNTTGNANTATTAATANNAINDGNGVNISLEVLNAGINATNQSLKIGANATNNDIVVAPGTGVTTSTNARVVTVNATIAGFSVGGDLTGNLPNPSLKNTGTAGTYTKATFDPQGRETAGAAAVLASLDFANQGTTTTVLHGNIAGNPFWGSVVENDFGFTDVTVANASTSKHGLLPKLDGNSGHYLGGDGNFTTPPGGSGVVAAGLGIDMATNSTLYTPSIHYPIVYASPIGLTNNTGVSPSSPWPMPYALTQVKGGILRLMQDSGGYTNHYWDVTSVNNGITIEPFGYPLVQWTVPIVCTDNPAIFVEPGVIATIQGLQVAYTSVDGVKAQNATNCVFRDLWLHDNTGNGILAQDGATNLFERIVANNNGINGVPNNHFHGIYASGFGLTIRSIVAYDNTNGYGIQIYGNVLASNNTACAIYNCLEYKNSRGITVAQQASCTNWIFNNTCISNINTSEQFYGTGNGTIYVSNSICENNGNGVLTLSGGVLKEDYNLVESSVSSPGTHDTVFATFSAVSGPKGLYWPTFGSIATGIGANQPPPVDFWGYPQTVNNDVGFVQYAPNNWKNWDTRTLYESSYPDYWDIPGTVPDMKLMNLFAGSGSSANLAAALTDETGSGLAVFGTSPTIATPTISSASASTFAGFNGSQILGSASLPSSALATALTDETGSGAAVFGTSPTLSGPVVSSATASTFAGFDGSKIAGSASLPSSALATALTDETGTGAAVFANTPTLVTPNWTGVSTGQSYRSNEVSAILNFPSATNSLPLYSGGGDWLLVSATPVNFTNAIGSTAGYIYSADVTVSNSTAAAFTNRCDPTWKARGYAATNALAVLGINGAVVPASGEIFWHVESRSQNETNYWISY